MEMLQATIMLFLSLSHFSQCSLSRWSRLPLLLTARVFPPPRAVPTDIPSGSRSVPSNEQGAAWLPLVIQR